MKMAKKFIAALLAATLLAGCGSPINIKTPSHPDGKVYPTYGFFNQNTEKSKEVCYKPSVGNVVLSIIFVETVVVPVYFVGFSIFNPIGPKDANGNCGIDAK